MYLTFATAEELASQLLAHPLEPDDYWMLWFAEAEAPKLPAIVDCLNQAQLGFFGALFPGLIHGSSRLQQGVIAQRIPCLAPPLLVDAHAADHPGLLDWPELSRRQRKHSTCLVLFDPLTTRFGDWLMALFHRYANDVTYFGVGAGFSDLRAQPMMMGPAGLCQQAAWIVLADITSCAQARHGWHRIQGPLVATYTLGTQICELDWQPAAQVYRAMLPDDVRHLSGADWWSKVIPWYPLLFVKEAGQDTVRDPMAFTPEGSLVCLTSVPEGSSVYLAQGSMESLMVAVTDAISSCRLTGPARRVLIGDCFSRAFALEDDFPRELQLASAELASKHPDLIAEGVLALSEIASDGEQIVEIYNKTFSLCLMQA